MPIHNSRPLAIRSGRVDSRSSEGVARRSARTTAADGVTTRSGVNTSISNRTGSRRARSRQTGPRQALQSPDGDPANTATQNDQDGGASRRAATAGPQLIEKVCLDSATANEKQLFQYKSNLEASFQLLAYRQLNSFCEDGSAEARKKAVRLDLALHPILQPHLFEFRDNILHRFLSTERNKATDLTIRDDQFAATHERELGARALSKNLIEKIVTATATADDRELFRLKWRFDRFDEYIKKRILKYQRVGRIQESLRLTDARAVENIELILDRMKNGMDWVGDPNTIPNGAQLANLVLRTAAGTTSAAEKRTFSLACRENFDFSGSAYTIAEWLQKRAAPQDQAQGERLEAEWLAADELLIDHIASRVASRSEAQTFKDGVRWGSLADSVVLRDEEYRALGSPLWRRKAAELRVILEKLGVGGRFPADASLVPYLHAATLHHDQLGGESLWD